MIRVSPQLLYDPAQKKRPMRVAGFMSGSGTNLIRIIEWEKKLSAEKGISPYEVVLIFTDNKASKAETISHRWKIPFVCYDIQEFYKSRGYKDKKDLSLRPLFDQQIVPSLEEHHIDLIALAGYMSIVSESLLAKFQGRIINVHPANLSAVEGGKRKYTGDKAVAKAILAGEPSLYSTTHIVRKEVDGGEILLISKPLKVNLPAGTDLNELKKSENKNLVLKIASDYQERLKETGDWIIFPYTLQLIAEGRVALSEDGIIHIDGEPRPEGFWM